MSAKCQKRTWRDSSWPPSIQRHTHPQLAAVDTKQPSRLANVTNRMAKALMSLVAPPFGARPRRASCILGTGVNCQLQVPALVAVNSQPR